MKVHTKIPDGRIILNHNQTVVRLVPLRIVNHNQTLVPASR